MKYFATFAIAGLLVAIDARISTSDAGCYRKQGGTCEYTSNSFGWNSDCTGPCFTAAGKQLPYEAPKKKPKAQPQ